MADYFPLRRKARHKPSCTAFSRPPIVYDADWMSEGISILENIGLMGVPLPAGLKKWLAKLNDDAKQDISEQVKHG